MCIHHVHKLVLCHSSHEPKIDTDGEHNTVHVKKKLYVTACFFIFLILSSNATKMYEGH